VRYRSPVPLDVELELVAECEAVDQTYTAMFEIRHDGQVLVEGDAELVSWEQFAARKKARERSEPPR